MLTLQAAVTPKTSVCSRRNVGQGGQGEWLGRGLPASLLQHCRPFLDNFPSAKATITLQLPCLGAQQPRARVQHLHDGREPLQRQHPLPGMATSPRATESGCCHDQIEPGGDGERRKKGEQGSLPVHGDHPAPQAGLLQIRQKKRQDLLEPLPCSAPCTTSSDNRAARSPPRTPSGGRIWGWAGGPALSPEHPPTRAISSISWGGNPKKPHAASPSSSS